MSVLLHSEQRKADADDLRWQFSQQLRLLPQSYQCFDILLSSVRPREATMFTIHIETGSRPRDQVRCGDLDYDAKLSPSMLVHRLQRPTISRLHLAPPLRLETHATNSTTHATAFYHVAICVLLSTTPYRPHEARFPRSKACRSPSRSSRF